jgi:hypothetical protein
MENQNGADSIQIIRWIARTTAALAAGLILVIFVGEGIAEGVGPLLQLNRRETALMITFTAAWLGLLVGWRWELIGGLLTVGAMIAFYLLDYLFSGTLPRGPYFLLIFSPSMLFLICGWLMRQEPRSCSAQP